jgi:2-dehydro-3-deoxyphosphogluconate aldolase/(4S)-4-hydroxy-2-oxoglutarate aldolase
MKSAMMTKSDVRTRIQEIGIIPSIHVSSIEDALFAAKEITAAGIPILELATIEPGAIEIIATLVREHPDLIVGAGELTDSETAQSCRNAGAKFLSGPGVELGLDSKTAESSIGMSPVIIPGALTPTEVLKAWKSSCDFVKVFPAPKWEAPTT